MQCENCGKTFPRKVWVEGKQRNCQHRRYCFECSPFGSHNTRKLNGEKLNDRRCRLHTRLCKLCGKTITRKNEKGKHCWGCMNRRNREEKLNKIKALVGEACWICGYDACWSAMDFHHIYPEHKAFELTVREMQFAWTRIESELRKCALLCCRCHREVHAGLIDLDTMVTIWQERWTREVSSTVEEPAHNG